MYSTKYVINIAYLVIMELPELYSKCRRDKVDNYFSLFIFYATRQLFTSKYAISPLAIIYTISIIHSTLISSSSKEITKHIGGKIYMEDFRSINDMINYPGIFMGNAIVSQKKFTKLFANIWKTVFLKEANDDMDLQFITETFLQSRIILLKKGFNILSSFKFDMKWKYAFTLVPNNNTLMRQIIDTSYNKNKYFRLVEIPFIESSFCFGIIINRHPMEEKFTPADLPILRRAELDELISNTQIRPVDIQIPKITQTTITDITPVLQKIGINKIFKTNNDMVTNESIAAFGISCQINITESGGIQKWSLKSSDKPIVFHPKQPFMYYIRNILNNNIIIVGNYF
jgi:hypothetical protein